MNKLQFYRSITILKVNDRVVSDGAL